ncbi:MAG: hypothetical protein ACTHK3_01725 [Solirubrobacterales bacterium]
MEALLEKEGTVENWNDDRLDELSGRMDAGFKEMREGFARVDERFERISDRLDRMNHTLLIGALGVIAALIANGIWG